MEADAVLAAGLANVPSSPVLDRAALEESFDRLLVANGPALARLAASYTDTASDRDDLLQEIALALWQALARFRGECSERTFLFRIAHNRAIAYLARARPRRMLEVASETEPEMPRRSIDAPDPGSDPERELAAAESADRLRGAVHRLPVVYRQVILLALEGLGYGEMADVLGISESNVGARLTRARQLLRTLLEERK